MLVDMAVVFFKCYKEALQVPVTMLHLTTGDIWERLTAEVLNTYRHSRALFGIQTTGTKGPKTVGGGLPKRSVLMGSKRSDEDFGATSYSGNHPVSNVDQDILLTARKTSKQKVRMGNTGKDLQWDYSSTEQLSEA
ncbi:hypothetical protein NDU88_005822 [Pleurodeles waltl]|uniref:Uncharacterized protein n=1 Tax=Pleurodeles waltl TaxID=8319 RepID=A0AAV7NRN3_PLEWA|nr:hypothetical protein NDU88_005822 [Pleurodeles waltl]